MTYQTNSKSTSPTVGAPDRNPAKRAAQSSTDMDSAPTISYAEACAHAEANYVSTNGLVRGGTYRVEFADGAHLVDLRIGASGIARPAR